MKKFYINHPINFFFECFILAIYAFFIILGFALSAGAIFAFWFSVLAVTIVIIIVTKTELIFINEEKIIFIKLSGRKTEIIISEIKEICLSENGVSETDGMIIKCWKITDNKNNSININYYNTRIKIIEKLKEQIGEDSSCDLI